MLLTLPTDMINWSTRPVLSLVPSYPLWW